MADKKTFTERLKAFLSSEQAEDTVVESTETETTEEVVEEVTEESETQETTEEVAEENKVVEASKETVKFSAEQTVELRKMFSEWFMELTEAVQEAKVVDNTETKEELKKVEPIKAKDIRQKQNLSFGEMSPLQQYRYLKNS